MFKKKKNNGKRFEICIVDFKFELGRAVLVKIWNSQDFTPSSRPIKYIFQ